MKIARESLKALEFEGLEIRDYTAERDVSSSMAEITVPAGVRHKRAWSKRSDKYYYVLDSRLSFIVDEQIIELAAGDVVIIRRGVRFSYENKTKRVAKVLLVHTPSFDLADEVLEE